MRGWTTQMTTAIRAYRVISTGMPCLQNVAAKFPAILPDREGIRSGGYDIWQPSLAPI